MSHEAIDLLSRYIRINTANPPGNEAAAAGFLADILAREGIEFKTYEAAPGRISLCGRLPGKGRKGALILLNHTDVVPADAAKWRVDPFAGEVSGGYIYGRGALDMKSQGIMELLAFLHLKRQGVKPERDVLFLAAADEEAGGRFGVDYLLRHHARDFEADLVLNEGGFNVTGLLNDKPICMIATAEKGVLWLKLTREGSPGHGSAPHGDNPLERLVEAIHRVLSAPPPFKVTPIVAQYFQTLAREWTFLEPFCADGKAGTLIRLLEERGLFGMPQVAALLRNTISFTVLEAGSKTNVIPGMAEAQVDMRLLPGEDVDRFRREFEKMLGDERIQVEPLQVSRPSASATDTPDYEAIHGVLAESFPNGLVAPSLLFGASDSRFFRERGIPAYGVCPITLGVEDISLVHGIDERLSEENMVRGTGIYQKIVRRLCCE